MTDKGAKRILCAVRGQPRSRSTADLAADLARQDDAELTYLLVIDAQFMSKTGPTMAPLRAVYEQLDAMGDFAMTMLADRARRRGVEQVDYIIRRGQVPQEIRTAVKELRPDTLVLGRPVQPLRHARFGPEEFDHFVQQLARETNIHIQVEEGSDHDASPSSQSEPQ